MGDTAEQVMPAAILPNESDDERQRRLVASAQGMPPVLPRSAPQPASFATMPPATLASATPEGDADGNDRDSEKFGHLDGMVRQSVLRRAVSLAEKEQRASQRPTPSAMPPVTTAQPASQPASASTMPPATSAQPSRSQPFPGSSAMPPITYQPTPTAQPPEEGKASMGATPSTPTAMPPASKAAMAAPSGSDTMPPVQIGPQQKAYEDLSAQGAPKLSGWKKALDAIGSIFPIGRAIETAIPGSPQNYDARLMQAAVRAAKEQGIAGTQQQQESAGAQAQFNTPEKRRAYMQAHPDEFDGATDFQKNDFVLAGKFPQREPAQKTERPENLDREAYDDYISRGMTPADARKRVLQDAQSVKPDRQTHTSPFEAFAYGDAEEKKAAQDFLDLEKRLGSRYRTPNEFEEKYRLFQEDPDAYKAMFGDKDKASIPDRATATKMLSYFDRRRREINQDFTLDDTQKQEQLKDIEGLEKPFMDAVQPGAGGGANDRVQVVHPDGRRGTIPRSQLGAAKKKGYRVAE